LLHILSEEELNKICQVKEKIVKLELRLEENEQLQSSVEISSNN
ncbi:24770_t:CDS:1, partial [Entrophospora sp. SA101]